MANTISTKIAIEGEKEYKKSIKEITQETKTLDAKLKEVSSRFDDETEAMDKAKESAELLQKKKEALERELETMQSHLEDVTSAYGDSSIEALKLEEQIAKVETQLNTTNSAIAENESVLSGVESEADSASDALGNVASAESDLADESTSMSSIFGGNIAGMADAVLTADITNILGGVVNGVVAIGEAAIESQRQYYQMIATIASGTGMTGDLNKEFAAAAQDLYASFPDVNNTLNNTAATVANLNTWFGITADQVDDFGGRVLQFSKVTGEDAAGSVEYIAKLMETWGMATDNSEESLNNMSLIMDKLQLAAENMNVPLSSVASNLNDDKVYADALGMSMDDLLGMYMAVEQSGGDLSDVSGTLKKAHDELSKAVDDAENSTMTEKDAWAEVKKAMEDSDSTTDALNTQIGDLGITLDDVFGTNRKAAQVVSRLTEGSASASEFSGLLSNASGEVDRIGAACETNEDKVRSFTRALSNLMTNPKYANNADRVDLGEMAFAKAMYQPYEFHGRQTITVGEAGPEVLVGKGMFDNLVAGATTNNYGGASISMNIYGSDGMSVNELARAVSEQLSREVERSRAAR